MGKRPHVEDSEMSPSDFLADVEVAVTSTTPDPRPGTSDDRDPWGDAVAAFLADLLDRPDVRVVTDAPVLDEDRPSDRIPSLPVRGADGRSRQISIAQEQQEPGLDATTPTIPDELTDLAAAALRALTRVTRSTAATEMVYPSVTRALHDVVIAEVLADRLAKRLGPGADLDHVALLMATTIEYVSDLAATRHEGVHVTHGVVIASNVRGLTPVSPPVWYPGRLPTRKRTPLLFDGTESVLVIAESGAVLGGFGRNSLPNRGDSSRIELFDELGGLDGSLTVAASATFGGVGFYLRADGSIWVFEDGIPLFIRRTRQWKSIAIRAFVEAVSSWGHTGQRIAELLVRAAIRLSIQNQGGVLAIAESNSAIAQNVQGKYQTPVAAEDHRNPSVDDELARLLPDGELSSSSLLARLARIDGATIIDRQGSLLAYGAIIDSSASGSEGPAMPQLEPCPRTPTSRSPSPRTGRSPCS